jgi:hypothetical protein
MPQPESDASGDHFPAPASLPWRPSTVADGVDVQDLGIANGQAMARSRCRPGAKPRQKILYAGAELNRLYPGCIISMSNHAV